MIEMEVKTVTADSDFAQEAWAKLPSSKGARVRAFHLFIYEEEGFEAQIFEAVSQITDEALEEWFFGEADGDYICTFHLIWCGREYRLLLNDLIKIDAVEENSDVYGD